MTVVKKQTEIGLENPDDYLPTVMTCQNYLKIPVYSDIRCLKKNYFLQCTKEEMLSIYEKN